VEGTNDRRKTKKLMKSTSSYLSGAAVGAFVLLTASANVRSSTETAEAQNVPGRTEAQAPLAAPGPNPFAARVLISPDGDFAVKTTADGRILYSHTRDGTLVRTLYGCTPTALSFSSDGQILGFAGEGGKLKVFYLQHSIETRIKTRLADRVIAIAVSPERLVISSKSGLSCFLLPEGTQEWSVPLQTEIRDLKFGAGGKSVVVSLPNGEIRTYDARTGLRPARYPKKEHKPDIAPQPLMENAARRLPCTVF
jgi:WD40 repeat protein